MPGNQERLNGETRRLIRFLDGEMLPDEAHAFRAHLDENPELMRKLHEMQRVGRLVRIWSAAAEARADELVEPTLRRLHAAEKKRSRQTALGYVLAVVLLALLPWSRHAPGVVGLAAPVRPSKASGAAIERVEARDQQAQVFVVGTSSTPVVWLADDAQDDDASEQDPG